VNVHGTGTPLNDAAEWRALERVFGERAAEIPLVATKALVGHLLGCSGALEAVATILCLREGELHPAPAGEPAAPELPARLVVGEPVSLDARAAVSTSLAFGGSNAALVFSRWTDRAA
jgi:3-oxoacyl-[acyl-carrier-protein] synthase II